MLRVRAPAVVVEYQPFAALADGARRDGRGALPQSGGQELVLLGWSSGSHQPPDFRTFSATVESASCLGCRGRCHGGSISGGHQGSYVRPILSPMQLHLGAQFAYCIRVTVRCKIENHERLLLLYAFSNH